jgi:hypothetical protein
MKSILKKVGVLILSKEEKIVTRICCEQMKKSLEKKKEPLEEMELRALKRIDSTLIKLS